MRIESVHIENFKNLKKFEVEFGIESPYMVLVGENGSGKSNLLEAITHIFRSIDLDLPAPFGYQIKYECRGCRVSVAANEGEYPRPALLDSNSGEYNPISKKSFMAEDDTQRPLYRPAFVFGYYSGPSDRLSSLYEKHRERYYKSIIKPKSQRQNLVDSNALRRLFYAQTLHGQFALLAFFMDADEASSGDRQFLREHLQIDALDSVMFVLKRPPWKRTGGDKRFWNAEGEVRDFLSYLYEEALSPLRMERRLNSDSGKSASIDSLYLFLAGGTALKKVYSTYENQYAFFTALESTYISKLLAEVRTRVRMTQEYGRAEVTYRDLSEGEQQLLLVLGLLKFTSEQETLFLLDEPDTHLNPSWSTQYLDFLNRFIKHAGSCHIFMTTHDPLVFSRLERDQVRIMRKDIDGNVVAECPEQDPRGMGVAAILTSDLFKLRTTLDPISQELLDRQQVLMAIDNPTDQDLKDLAEISSKVRGLGLSQTIRDPLYHLFQKAWVEQADPAWAKQVELTKEQLEERERLALRIVEELRNEGE